jgi:uncharacterized protein
MQAQEPTSDRIHLLDALRGFTLLGVLVMHTNQLAVDPFIVNPDLGSLTSIALDRWVDRFVHVFVQEKAQTLFCAMFGISFAIQMGRLESRFDNAAALYRRRIFGLFIIGLLHLLLLPAADILVYLAIGGLVLLMTRGLETRALCALGLLLALVVMPTADLVNGLEHGSPPVGTIGHVQAPAIYLYGSYLEIMEVYWPRIWFVEHLEGGLLTFQLYVLGRLMLGVVVMRTGVLTEPVRHRRALVWAAAIGVLGGILLSESLWAERWEESAGWIKSAQPWRSLARYLMQAGTLLLAAGYAALFALAWQANLWRRVLSMFAPMGRMAVTNYLLQTVFISLVFYGFGLGLLGRVHSTWCFLLALAFFSLQCILSKFWLEAFRFGPVEGLWRAWTYNKPIRWRRELARTTHF